jgi:O-antigen ligase
MPTLTRFATGLRLFVIYLVVASVSLPMAWVSLGKLMLFIGSLTYLSFAFLDKESNEQVNRLWSVRLILAILITFASSLMWSEASFDVAVMAFTKHSKLLEIAMLVILIRNIREARMALLVFFVSQVIFILSSWVMAAGIRVPWATSALIPQFKYVVYSTYLDQTLIFSAAAAVFWHLRQQFRVAPWVAVLFAALAVTNNLFLQEGKTGYLTTLAVIALAAMWEIPKKWRLAMLVLVPAIVGATMYASSSKFQGKVGQVMSESQSYSSQGDNVTSSGFRLHAWRRSLQAMAEQPWLGHGVGSWTQSVKRIEGVDANKVFGEGLTSNPHQEYLLWGVELGIGGTMLFLALIAALVRDFSRFDEPVKRAALSVVAVMAVACLFNSSLYDALIGDFFCVSLGLLLALGIRSKNTDASWGTTSRLRPGI